MKFQIDYKFLLIFHFILQGFLSLEAQETDFGKYGVYAEGHIPKGLAVGDKAPDFRFYDNGNLQSLHKVLKDRAVVIIFYRGVWCPVCMRHLANLQDSLSYLTDRGVKVLAVTPEISENVKKTRDHTGARFTIVSDHSEEIMRNYDVWFRVTNYYQNKVRIGRLADIAANNGTDEARLPVPATFIIDKSGVIVYRRFDINYKNRASVKDILDHLP